MAQSDMPNRSRKHEDADQIAFRTIGEMTGEIEGRKKKTLPPSL